jgi:hypothetical protein
MNEGTREQLITELESQYGPWDQDRARFGDTSYGAIARALSISASQFSKLISGTATDGMYARNVENVRRIHLRDSLRRERDEARDAAATLSEELRRLHGHRRRHTAVWLAVGLLIGATLFALTSLFPTSPAPAPPPKSHPLTNYFDRSYDEEFTSPYLDISEVQDYCPCSAYEGSWELSEPYKLPLPGTRKPGVYYVAKSADVRMKCSRYDTFPPGRGRVLMGYEYLVNEVWVDTRMRPLSPTYFDKGSKTFTTEFKELDFAADPHFKKVATINSFFVDRFEIYPDSIIRRGEPYGRYATELDQQLASDYEIDIKFILNEVLGDLTTTSCSATTNPYCDPNTLEEGRSVIAFDCRYTIQSENLGLDKGYPYTKGYRLSEQAYAANLTCGCEGEID